MKVTLRCRLSPGSTPVGKTNMFDLEIECNDMDEAKAEVEKIANYGTWNYDKALRFSTFYPANAFLAVDLKPTDQIT